MDYRFAVFACGDVGAAAVKMFKGGGAKLKLVVLDRSDFWHKNSLITDAAGLCTDAEIIYYENDGQLLEKCRDIDCVILAWWGKIIREPLLSAVRCGFLNLHTSFLPYGKGKNPHYWAIVEEAPYGVTVMKIDGGLDTGAVIYQKEIEYSWEDTGKSLYFKGIREMCLLLEDKKDHILNLDFSCEDQEGNGSFHYGKEMDKDCCIKLEERYRARDLLNKLRARTFYPFPAAYFVEDGCRYEIRVEIKCVDKEFDPNELDYTAIHVD